MSLEQKAVKDCENSTMRNIYLNESLFYFELAMQAMREKRIFEIHNKNRSYYSDFLDEMNPQFILDVFKKSKESLERMFNFINYNQPDEKTNIMNKLDIMQQKYALIIKDINQQIK